MDSLDLSRQLAEQRTKLQELAHVDAHFQLDLALMTRLSALYATGILSAKLAKRNSTSRQSVYVCAILERKSQGLTVRLTFLRAALSFSALSIMD